jgi:hypothetical protein
MTQKVITLCSNKGFILSGLATSQGSCCDPSLGLVTKAKGLQVCRPRLSLGIALSCLREYKKE